MLYREFARCLALTDARFAVVENVAGLAWLDGGRHLQQHLATIAGAGRGCVTTHAVRQADRERHARELQATRAEERMELAMAALHFLSAHLPSRDRIAAHWCQAGPPPDVMNRLLQVRQAPAEWRSLLQIPDGNGEADSR